MTTPTTPPTDRELDDFYGPGTYIDLPTCPDCNGEGVVHEYDGSLIGECSRCQGSGADIDKDGPDLAEATHYPPEEVNAQPAWLDMPDPLNGAA